MHTLIQLVIHYLYLYTVLCRSCTLVCNNVYMKWECVIALYGNTFIYEQLIPEDIVGDDVEHNPNQHQRNSRGDKEGVCMPEQENLEEHAKQDNEKNIKKERRNMNINVNSHGQEKNINLEEKKELRI